MDSWSALHRDPNTPSPQSSIQENPSPAFGMSQEAADDDAKGRTAKLMDLAMQVQLNGIDVAQAVKDPQQQQAVHRAWGKGSGLKDDAGTEWEVKKLHLEACQIVMDECYDKGIHPLVEALEARVYEGDASPAEQNTFSAYTGSRSCAASHQRMHACPPSYLGFQGLGLSV
jgi:hypothetical protein